VPSRKHNKYRRGLPEATSSDVQWYCIPIPTDKQYRAAWLGSFNQFANANGWDREQTDKRYEVAAWWENYAATLPDLMRPCDEHEQCREYYPAASIISYHPCSPFLEECDLPAGYNNAPFTVVGNGNLSEIIGVYGLGYQVGDVFTDLLHLPDGDWSTVLEGWRFFPRVSVTATGSGTVKIQFLNIPQGGRGLVVLDDDFNLFNPTTWRLVELNKDLVSIPPETTAPFVYELEVTGEGEHLIEIAFLPTVDDTPIPIFFGGGIRSIELCGFGLEGCPDMTDCCDETNNLLGKILSLMEGGMTLSFNQQNLGDFQVDCTPTNFDEDEGDDEPTIADRKLALCATVARYIAATLYVEAVTQNSGPTLKTAIKGLIEPLEIPDEFIRGLVLGVPDEIPDLSTLYLFVTEDPAFWEAVVCNMVSGLLGKENTFANFRAAVTLVGEDPAVEPGFIRLHKIQKLLMKTNAIRSNYVMFAKSLDAALAEVQDEEFAYSCPCEFTEPDGCAIPLELTYTPSAAYPVITITPMGGNIYRIQQEATEHVDGFYWAEIKDANAQCLKFENPPEGSGFTAQGVAGNNYVDCADVTHNDNVGGFAPLEAKLMQWKQGDPMDTYYKITCVE